MTGRTVGGYITATLFAIAAGAVLPIAFVGSAVVTPRLDEYIVVVGILLYATAHLAELIILGEKRPLQGVFWIFVYVSMGVAPLAQLVTGQSQRVMATEQVRWAYYLVLAGLLAYDIGVLIAKRREARADIPPSWVVEAPRERELGRTRVIIVSVVALGFCVVQVGQRGIGAFFTSRQESVESFALANPDVQSEGQVVRGILSAFGTVPPLIALLCWLFIAAQERRSLGKSSLSTKLWIAGLLACNVIVNNPLVNSRFWFLTVAVSFLFALPWVASKVYRAVIIGGVAGSVLVFPLSDVFRLSANYRAQFGFTSRGVIENLAVKDYDQMVMIANGLWYVDERNFHFGYQMLGNLTFWVPRQFWPTKPIDTGVEIGRAMNSANVNLSSPLWIELYIDFWLIGVIGVFLVIGYLSRIGDSAFSRSEPHRYTAIALLVPLLAGYQFILLRGPLLQSMGRLAVILLLVWFVFPRAQAQVQTISGRAPSQLARDVQWPHRAPHEG